MPRTLDSTPKQDGFRMPGEFEEHKQCWMIWPERTDNWRLGAHYAQKAFVEVASAISEFEPVTMCVSSKQYDNARDMLPEHIRVIEMASDDSWMRDVGPTFLVNGHGEIRGADWQFNAWGGLEDGLYFPWDQDDKIAKKVCEIENIDTYRFDGFILEGGSIHVDGEGTCLVTEECLLSEGRNNHLTREEIEDRLKEGLNVEKIIWIKEGIYNDETNGHVDNIVCFARPGEVLLAWTDDENDPQYPRSKAAYEVLTSVTDAKGRKIKVHKLHIPTPIIITKEESEGVDAVDGTLPRSEGDRQAASYINFYIANNGIIFPLFNDEKYDKLAEEKLKEVFPEYDVRGVYAREIILGGGNIHCITQQQPAEKK
ncbi:agmatine deiminase [Wukongibacter sp. M2B1]|uniref:agmatine deiminase n=1 Tax=Wukongibacter sp. M2B1 TaxID=3088895 RepID=UPI003D79CE8D